jgi:glycosyltransferase involved in cell wall biosynthesis
MKSLFLVQKEQRVILDRFYDSICRHLGDCELRRLSSSEQGDLRAYFNDIDLSAYDRVILFLRFKKEIKQVNFIRQIPNLVILEHDAYQNYIEGKYQGVFGKYYRQLPWARIINSGYQVSEKLRSEGFDSVFVPKGYDQKHLRNLHKCRDIELGFLGSVENKTYKKRKELLKSLSEAENLVIARTNSGDEYLAMLNRIKMFVGADIGFGEYMIKNFEAMACGCLLLTWDQGNRENRALGLEDMVNVVLFRDLDELRQKLTKLRSTPSLIEQIAARGQKLVEVQYGWEMLGQKVAEEIKKPLREKTVKSFLGIKRYSWEG